MVLKCTLQICIQGLLLLKRTFLFFLAQEILNSFYGTIRIYCFNSTEMKFGTRTYSSNVFQTKMRKRKKKKKGSRSGRRKGNGRGRQKKEDCLHN